MYDQNLNFSQISQNGQKGQVNLDEVSGIHVIGYACLGIQRIVNGLERLINKY